MAKTIGIGAKVNHPKFGEGVIYGMDISFYKIYFKQLGEKEIARDFELDVLEEGEPVEEGLTMETVELALITVLQKFADFTPIIPLGDKWRNGKMILQPGDRSLQGKEIPIDVFFHKIVMVRDRLRVLEQNINSNKTMSDEEKVNLQQYITRIYGSLTTFNILFKQKEDYFVGDSGKN